MRGAELEPLGAKATMKKGMGEQDASHIDRRGAAPHNHSELA